MSLAFFSLIGMHKRTQCKAMDAGGRQLGARTGSYRYLEMHERFTTTTIVELARTMLDACSPISLFYLFLLSAFVTALPVVQDQATFSSSDLLGWIDPRINGGRLLDVSTLPLTVLSTADYNDAVHL